MIKVDGKLQQPIQATLSMTQSPLGNKVLDHPPGKEPRPAVALAEGKGNMSCIPEGSYTPILSIAI